VRLYWHILWPLTSVLQERDHSISSESLTLHIPEDDVAPCFHLRETHCDEEMTCVELDLDEGHSLLHFQLSEPPDGHSGPKLSICANMWGVSDILL
jgi:hypothetical protein